MPATTLDPACTTAAIRDLLRARLGSQWRVGDRLPPVKDLARQLGTGQNNTHMAVQTLTREGLLVSRRKRGTFVASLPPEAARLQGRLITVHSSRRRYHQRMAAAIIAAVKSEGATVRMAEPQDPGADHDADALVYINPSARKPIAARPQQILSVVATTRAVSVVDHSRYDLVCVDEHEGGAMAGQMLRDCGCRSVCYIGRQLDSDPSRFDAISSVRLHGFETGWGAALAPDQLIRAETYHPMAGGKAFGAYMALKNRPQGVFTSSDDLAYGFLIAAGSQGLTPGKDFHLVGFDGQGLSEDLGVTDLSTIQVPCEQLGQRAAQLLIERFADPNRPVEHAICRCQAYQGRTTCI